MRRGPLRYPGAKWRLAPAAEKFLEFNCLVGANLVEPFGGSAAVGRTLLAKRVISTLTVIERDPLMAAFWRAISKRSSQLLNDIRTAKVDLESYIEIKEQSAKSGDDDFKAFACVYLNRTNFSGILNAGPIGGMSQSSVYKIDCRFNKESLVRDLEFWYTYSDRICVLEANGISWIEEGCEADTVLYVDPPYFTNGKKFYPKFFSTFDHYRLRRALEKSCIPWLLSYDMNKKVEYLYRKQFLCPIELHNSAKGVGKKGELLVSNHPFLRTQSGRNLAAEIATDIGVSSAV
ncbi:DNA adenine methylase [Oceanicaulis alexandrii]|uniref:DNA adenine methylase n=1 Tax=Oceanicaulis alexandrii TaxID=153233 RepID=UPI003BAFFE3E